MAAKRIIYTVLAPKPIGPYSQGVLVNDTLYVSGQIGMTAENPHLLDGIEAQTEQALKNIGAILAAANGDFSSVVKMTVLLTDLNNFDTMNNIYARFFKSDFPARAAYQVSRLPRDALVEIEAIATVKAQPELKHSL